MKKKYIQPTVSVSFVVVESQLLSGGSGPGAQKGQNDWGGGAKKHEFTDDSFDTAWPKNKSPWED